MTLYEINQEILNCIKIDDDTMVNAETGEVIDLERLHDLNMERSAKIKNIALWQKNEAAIAEEIKAEEQRLYDRRKAHETKAKTLKSYLENVMQGEKYEDAQCKISWRKSQAVVITDAARIPSNYFVPQEPKLDKMAVKKDLKAGIDIDGAAIEEHQNIQIK